jgi:predicted ATP-binding protein involved in virulence
MRLVSLTLQNFRGYANREFSLHPEFNLIVGENGAGKTSLLEAAAVAIGSWFLGIREHDSRNIRPRDVRIVRDMVEKRYRELPQYPVKVKARGTFWIAQAARNAASGRIDFVEEPRERTIEWERTLDGAKGRTTQAGATPIKKVAQAMSKSVYDGEPRVLPLIRYFGAGRLWETVRDSDRKAISKHKGKQPADIASDADEFDKILHEHAKLSEPFYGYRLSVDKRCNPDDLIRWMAFERRGELEEENESVALRLVYSVVEGMLEHTKSVRYSVKLQTLIIHFEDGRRLSFEELSDGFRNVVAMVADLAIKAVMLNPHLGKDALALTPGVVLIDELDLHLHPVWQREIIESLRKTFPKVQFLCTTHSPFLIQSLRSGAELVVLDGQPTATLANMTLEEIAEGIMGVTSAEVGDRYMEMKNIAREYLEELEKAAETPREKLAAFRDRLAESIAPYADNPAFQAFLEMKRAARLGE